MLDGFGPLSQHMVKHLFAMSVAAPLAAWLWRPLPRALLARWLPGLTLLQLALLWGSHAPPVLGTHGPHHAVLLVLLFFSAWAFWASVSADRGGSRWRGVVALLFTGKLFCLLGVLLAFAPRVLYGHGVTLADQQLAGLLMVVVCPLTYVAHGVWIAARWLAEMEAEDPGAAPQGVT